MEKCLQSGKAKAYKTLKVSLKKPRGPTRKASTAPPSPAMSETLFTPDPSNHNTSSLADNITYYLSLWPKLEVKFDIIQHTIEDMA
ncbi:Hypothetical predicted protein [Pelobates cultripes]|uniref:Uncharacterized protein n=1 Tax=Pelobates cultripes TaxID=61616 RepID=A0AAD1SSL1_PELCU|nr:Hypothetical predicted protein [Pelobates cultripes]